MNRSAASSRGGWCCPPARPPRPSRSRRSRRSLRPAGRRRHPRRSTPRTRAASAQVGTGTRVFRPTDRLGLVGTLVSFGMADHRNEALRFGDTRVMALASVLCHQLHAVDGFSNKSLRALVAAALDGDYSQSRMSYDRRRLRLHGLIQRLPRSDTYVLTPAGIRIAVFYSKLQKPAAAPAARRRQTSRADRNPQRPQDTRNAPSTTTSTRHESHPPHKTRHNVTTSRPQPSSSPARRRESHGPKVLRSCRTDVPGVRSPRRCATHDGNRRRQDRRPFSRSRPTIRMSGAPGGSLRCRRTGHDVFSRGAPSAVASAAERRKGESACDPQL